MQNTMVVDDRPLGKKRINLGAGEWDWKWQLSSDLTASMKKGEGKKEKIVSITE